MLVGDLVYNDYFTATVITGYMTAQRKIPIMTTVRNVSMMQSEMATGNPLTQSLICRFCI